MTNPFKRDFKFSPTLFVGRRREEWGILDRLANSQSRVSSAVYGQSGMGKTWLLECIKQLRLFVEWEIENEIILISLNCKEINPWTSESFWGTIFQDLQTKDIPLSAQEVVEELLRTSPSNSLLTGQLLDRIAENGRFLALLLDEFDWAVEHENPEDPSFLNALRSLLVREKKGLGIVLTTTQVLNTLLTGRRFRFVVSPFDNVFYPVELKPFTETEIRDFIEVRLKNKPVHFTEPEIRSLIKASAGHPDHLREACFKLFEDKSA